LAVAIRLTRVGATKRPAYRVIAIDKRRSRDGRALEILGFYDPLTEPATVQLNTDKINAWIGKGAQPSDTVVRLMRQAEKEAAAPAQTEKPRRATRSATPKASSKAATKAKAKAKAEAEASEADATAEAPAEEPPAAAAPAAEEPAPDEAQPAEEAASAEEAATTPKNEKADA
jgi:small subunit ribosomal protein S16